MPGPPSASHLLGTLGACHGRSGSSFVRQSTALGPTSDLPPSGVTPRQGSTVSILRKPTVPCFRRKGRASPSAREQMTGPSWGQCVRQEGVGAAAPAPFRPRPQAQAACQASLSTRASASAGPSGRERAAEPVLLPCAGPVSFIPGSSLRVGSDRTAGQAQVIELGL